VKMKPLGNQVFVRKLMPSVKNVGGTMIIPDEARTRPQKGIVVAVGPGGFSELGHRVPMQDVAPGDLVCFGEFAGVEVPIEGEGLLLMRDVELLAVKRAEDVALVEHVLDAVTGRRVFHEADETCDDCAKPDPIPAPDAPRADLSAMREQLKGEGVIG